MALKKGIHSASSEELEGALKTRLPYLSSVSYHVSPIIVSILERLTQTHEHYQEHVVKNALLHYAKSKLPPHEFNDLIAEAESTIYPVEYFDKNRQVGVFNSNLSDDELTELNDSTKNTDSSYSLFNSQTNSVLAKKIMSRFSFATQSYYMQLDGYFPPDLETIEGLYVHYIQSSDKDGKIYNDASKDFSRQVTVMLIIESHSSTLNLSGTDGPRIELLPGQIIILPSNFSATYRIVGNQQNVKILKAFLHENEEDLKC